MTERNRRGYASVPLFGDDTAPRKRENVRMASHKIECLRCGAYRSVSDGGRHRLDAGECPRCGYVGWAVPIELSESTRQRIRRLPPDRRARLYAV
jgi:hypothetical protein